VYIAQNVDKDDFDMDTNEGKKKYKEEVEKAVSVWRENIAEKVTSEAFSNRHAGTVTIQLHMRKKEGSNDRICDPEGKKSDVDELLGLLKNLQREKIEAANFQIPDVDKLMGAVAKDFGKELPSDKEMQQLKAKIAELQSNKEERQAESDKIMKQLMLQSEEQRKMIRSLANRPDPKPCIVTVPGPTCCIS